MTFQYEDFSNNKIHNPLKILAYRAWDEGTQTGIAEMQGRRPSQEDRLAIFLTNGFNELTKQQKINTLKTLVHNLQQQCGETDECGSTLIATIVSNEGIYTINVGDSYAFIVTFDEQDQAQTITRLNPVLHHPGEPGEKQRLPERYVFQFDGGISRLGPDPYYSLAISRAIGDKEFEVYGLSHEPDICFHPITTTLNTWVLVACDGLMEADCLTENDILQIINKHQGKSLAEIAQALTLSAYEGGSYDNISVIISPLDPTQSKTKVLALFDGHGGTAVSECLSKNFQQQMQQLLRK